MNEEELRDYITVEDEDGVEKLFAIEAMFDMNGRTYALLRSGQGEADTFVMQVTEDENGQHLVGIDNKDDMKMLMDAYEIAVDANPAD
jgi:uncharacterized protein YrzB (UPF0473 family)